MNLESIRADYLNLCRLIRNINNIIQNDNFEIAFNSSSPTERETLLQAISEDDIDSLKQTIRNKLEGTDYERIGIRRLREIGKELKITNYHLLNKMTLIEEIREVIKVRKHEALRQKTHVTNTQSVS